MILELLTVTELYSLIVIMSEHQKIQPHISKRFEILKKIGSGAYGIVWKVQERRNRKFYALKKNFDAFQNSTDAQRTYRQIMFLQKFKHPHIVKLKQVIRAANERDIYLLFEFIDIDLYSLVRENMLGEQHKRYVVYQTAKALHYLHTAELIHRDIKPSNVLVTQDCSAKICDFGLVRSVEGEEEMPNVLTEYIATRWYRAPEIILGSKAYSKAADVWSFGCMIGEIVRGKAMFPGHSTLNQIQRVLQWTGPPTIQDLKALKTDFGKEMLEILTKIKPVNKKEWFTNCPPEAMDLLTRTLCFNPEKRLTMLEIIRHAYVKQFFHKSEIIEAEGKIRIQIDDNQKLTLKQYRELIYKIVEDEESLHKSQPGAGLSESMIEKPQPSSQIDPQSRTVYKNRHGKAALVRSASKNKQESLPKSTQKESKTVSLKKKYENLMGKAREEMTRTKYVKTQQIQQQGIALPKRKKSDNAVKYYTADKKKKSVSLYEAKRDSESLAKYMYENRKI